MSAGPPLSESADFIAKLRQIEELANALGPELYTTRAQTRAQHIALLARALRGRLELGVVTVVSTGTPGEPADEEQKPPR